MYVSLLSFSEEALFEVNPFYIQSKSHPTKSSLQSSFGTAFLVFILTIGRDLRCAALAEWVQIGVIPAGNVARSSLSARFVKIDQNRDLCPKENVFLRTRIFI